MDLAPDPITTEIIRNAFLASADDMNAVLIRSAHTPIVYEGMDCSVAILDEHGDVLGQSSGLPLFLGNLEACVKMTAELHGWKAFGKGDIFFVNDSYMTGTHLNDATIFGPIHWRERLIGFSATRAHWLDVGAKDPGGPMDSHEIFQEGMRWAPTRIFEDGRLREDVVDILRRNSRFGSALVGDLHAQVAACRTGEARFQAILDRFGMRTYLAARDEIFRQSALLERESLASIPDGTYHAQGFLDNDGLGHGPIAVEVRVDISGDEMVIDLEGSAAQTHGPVNCGFAQTVSACRVAFKQLVNPKRPVDGGTFKSLTVNAPEGSIFAAQEPAACQWYFSSLGLLIDLVGAALAPAIPDRVAAAHYGDSMVVYISGRDSEHGEEPFLYVMPHSGGWGGFEGGDGADGLVNNVNGGSKNVPIEVFETRYPALITGYGFLCDSGGPGRYRGGCGVFRSYEVRADAALYLWFERSVTPAWGLFEGIAGAGPTVVVRPIASEELHLLKVNGLPLVRGASFEVRTGGGGGFGNPKERELGRVTGDVLDGYVSASSAAADYGVSLRDDLTVDECASRVLRRNL